VNVSRKRSWAWSARYWRIVPASSKVVLFAAIFLLFAAVGLVNSFFGDTWLHLRWAMLAAVVTGIFSMSWAYAAMRRIIWLMFVLAALQFVVFSLMSTLMNRYSRPITPDHITFAATQARLRIEGVVLIISIVASYVLILVFISKEGRRVFGPVTEVELAREVHQQLVPEIAQTIGPFEIYGISLPSGQVGGDLVDIVEADGSWMAFVADVSGHGVPAGMIMALVKSALYMGAQEAHSLPALLTHLNRVLKRILPPNAFVTFACVLGTSDSQMQFSLAGHYPILHYRRSAGVVDELTVSNPPLAVFADTDFSTSSLMCEQGDVLAIVTDGLIEAANSRGDELGLSPLETILLQSGERPLPEVARALRAAALRQGAQADDQTVLLVRRTSAKLEPRANSLPAHLPSL